MWGRGSILFWGQGSDGGKTRDSSVGGGGGALPRDWALKEESGLGGQRGGAYCGGGNEVYLQSLEIQNK